MYDIPVFVGSKKRLDYTIHKFFKHTLFVEKDDFENYSKINKHKEIVQLKDSNRGFGYLLQSMCEYAKDNNIKYFLFADDDIYGMKSRKHKEFIASDMIKRGVEIMKKNNYAQLGVSL